MLASLSRQLQGVKVVRIPTSDSRSLQRGSEGPPAASERPLRRALALGALGCWLLLPLCCLADERLQAPLTLLLWPGAQRK